MADIGVFGYGLTLCDAMWNTLKMQGNIFCWNMHNYIPEYQGHIQEVRKLRAEYLEL
jgi:hypothetical protein